jgi:hypothetical protein
MVHLTEMKMAKYLNFISFVTCFEILERVSIKNYGEETLVTYKYSVDN